MEYIENECRVCHKPLTAGFTACGSACLNRERESDKGDYAAPCDCCGAPEGSGHYATCRFSE